MRKILQAYFLPLAVMYCLLMPETGLAGVVVQDVLAVVGRAVMLQATVKGLLLPRGGQMVRFYVEDQLLGETLSGGDGLARYEYVPERKGLYRIKAVCGSDTGYGHLLAVSTRTPVVLLELESLTARLLYNEQLKKEALKVIETLKDRAAIVYVSGTPVMALQRRIIARMDLPVSVVVEWDDGGVLEELKERGINLLGFIGSPLLCQQALEYVKKSITFGSSEGCIEVDQWKEIQKALFE